MPKIHALFKELMDQGGSDLHLEQGQKPKLRLNGKMQELENYELLSQEILSGILKEIVNKDSWLSFENRGDLDFAYSLGQEARFRANYFRHFNGYGAIFRLIPSRITRLLDLGMPDVLKTFADTRSGLILVTGPTGSGKSTTLAAIIDYINEMKTKRIITIEEPVEFIHTNKKSLISHREVGLDTQNFASGLRAAIKSDPNIILVGEMRDQETIHLALTAAEMGILVFGTLHTNSAAKTIDRIIDVFPANKKNQIRTSLANNLRAVVAQQLLRSIDGKRRWVAYEILLRTTALGPIIQTGETAKLTSEIQTHRQMGMILMDECLLRLIKEGKVSQEEAHMKALDKTRFVMPLGGNSYNTSFDNTQNF